MFSAKSTGIIRFVMVVFLLGLLFGCGHHGHSGSDGDTTGVNSDTTTGDNTNTDTTDTTDTGGTNNNNNTGGNNNSNNDTGGGTGVLSVADTYPKDDATDVDVDTTLTVTFSEEIQSASLTTGTFAVKSSDTFLTGTVTCVGNRAIYTPSAPLEPGTTYTVTLSTGVKNTDGETMGKEFIWTFTTEE